MGAAAEGSAGPCFRPQLTDRRGCSAGIGETDCAVAFVPAPQTCIPLVFGVGCLSTGPTGFVLRAGSGGGGAPSGGGGPPKRSKIGGQQRTYQMPLFPTEAYDRQGHYGYTPTDTQRKSVPAGFEFDHDPPLVKHYYEGVDGIPGFRMTQEERVAYASSLESGSAATAAEQRAQGALAAYSKQMKRMFAL